MSTYATFTLEVEVVDEAELIAAAKAKMVEGGDEVDGEVTLDEAVRWLLDPGLSPPGLEIQDSSCEVFSRP